jgi:hypothetical protein
MHADTPEFPPPASAGLTYYPARLQRVYPTVRAALASIGCTGDVAALHLGNAAAERSDMVAVPVKPQRGGPEYLALVQRKPGGRAALFIGIPDEARADHAEALQVLAELSEGAPGTWGLIARTRQGRAVQ